jgi:arginine N-succinyltransferase
MGEGFRYQNLVDIFDAGPTVACPRDDIRTVRETRALGVEIGDPGETGPVLVSTTAVADFRAVRTSATINDGHILLPPKAAQALRVQAGDTVRVKA